MSTSHYKQLPFFSSTSTCIWPPAIRGPIPDFIPVYKCEICLWLGAQKTTKVERKPSLLFRSVNVVFNFLSQIIFIFLLFQLH